MVFSSVEKNDHIKDDDHTKDGHAKDGRQYLVRASFFLLSLIHI